MKTKLSKKLMSLLLAAMMVVTSIPLTAITAFGAVGDSVDTTSIDEAMGLFEAKLNNTMNYGTIWKNMGTGYQRYVEAQLARDAAVYGGNSANLSTADSNLRAAVTSMTEFTYPVFDAPAYYVEQVADGGYDNVVYCGSNQTTFSGETTNAGLKFKYILPTNIVLAYDGVTAPALPAVMQTLVPGKTFCSSQKIVYCASNNSTLYFDTLWEGYMDENSDHDYKCWPKNYIGVTTYLGATSSNTANVHAPNNTSTWRFWWNKLVYHGTGDTTNYYETISNLGLNCYHTYENWGSKTGTCTPSVSNNVYIINYGAIRSLIAGYISDLQNTAFAGTKTIQNYKEGGLTDVMNALGNLTVDNLNPNNSIYTYSNDMTNAVTSCAGNIKTAVEANRNKTIGSVDSADYAELRSALDDNRAIYTAGQATWSDETWPAFEDAYPAAAGVFTNITAYNDASTAAEKASDLRTARTGLAEDASALPRVDTAALEIAINNAQDAINNSDRFTTVSFSAARLATLVLNAKNEIWQGEANYGNPVMKLQDTEENQNTVTTHYNLITTAIASLKPNLNVTVPNAGNQSMNELYTQASRLNSADFENFEEIADELNAVNEFMNNPDPIDGTQANAVQTGIDLYQGLCISLYDSMNQLRYSFLAIPDGTIAQMHTCDNPITASASHSGGYKQSIGFSYTDSAIVFIKDHSASTRVYKFGTTSFVFATNVDADDRVNNMLDSFTINAPSDISQSDEFNKGSNGTDAPSAISDTSKYSNGFAADAFSITNLTIAQRLNNDSPYTCLDENGNNITDFNDSRIESLLCIAQGSDTKPARGGVFVNSSVPSGYGHVVLGSDFNAEFPANNSTTLTEYTLPSITPVTYTGHNLGALSVWNMESWGIKYCGYTYFKSTDTIEATVNFVDISNLVDLVNLAATAEANKDMYTTASYSAYKTSFDAAKASLDYNDMPISEIKDEIESRYQNLYRDYYGLEVKQFDIVFNYKTSSGADTSRTIKVEYGKTLRTVESDINGIDPSNYDVDNGKVTKVFNGWDPELTDAVYDTQVYADMSFTAQYTDRNNNADWTAYNTKRDELLGKIENGDNKYYSDNMTDANTAITTTLSFIDYTAIQQEVTSSSLQSYIDEEITKIDDIINTYFIETSIDFDTAKATADLAKNSLEDIDKYDTSALDKYYAESFYYTTVTVHGTSVICYTYTDQNALDDEIQNVAESLNDPNNLRTYTIYLDGDQVATGIAYGTSVIVDANGSVHSDVADTNETTYDGTSVAWRYSYAAPSNDFVQTAPKYMLTSSCFGFVLKGDVYLTTSKAKTSGNSYLVTVVSDVNGKVIDKVTTSGTYTMPIAPNYTGYAFAGYANGATAGQEITVTGDTTITANYSVRTAESFQIDFYQSIQDFIDYYGTEDEEVIDIRTVRYNDLVQLTGDSDTYCWAIVSWPDEVIEFTVISYSQNFNFYAFEDLSVSNSKAILKLTENDYKYVVSGYDMTNGMFMEEFYGYPFAMYNTQGVQITATGDYSRGFTYKPVEPEVRSLDELVNIYNDNGTIAKYSMVGQYIIPSGYEMVECGFIYASNVAVTDPKLDKVDNTSVFRFKCSRYTCGNQFVINLVNDGVTTTFNYVPYTIVRNTTTNALTTVYGTTHLNVTIND